MCDICMVKGPAELDCQLVLIKCESTYHGTFSICTRTEMSRAYASVCERCYQEKTGWKKERSKRPDSLLTSVRRWIHEVDRPTKAFFVFSLAKDKLSKLHPTEVAKAVFGERAASGFVVYRIKHATEWDAERRSYSEKIRT
jgi:hypothetical protein